VTKAFPKILRGSRTLENSARLAALIAFMASSGNQALDAARHQRLEDCLGHGAKDVALIMLLRQFDQLMLVSTIRRSLGPWLRSVNSTMAEGLDGHLGCTAGEQRRRRSRGLTRVDAFASRLRRP